MNMFKRMMALALALVMVLSLAACGGTAEDKPAETKPADVPQETQGQEVVESGEFDPRSVTEGVTLTVAVPMLVYLSDWENNEVTKMIEEDLGVNLEFEVYASADFSEKLNVMVNGGDKLPDMIWADSGSSANIYNNIQDWGNAGALYDLSEYFANPDYAVNINWAMERENDRFIDRNKDAEGRIWSMPTYLAAPRDQVPYNLLINGEFVKKLGMEMPTTTDEFLELARAFKAAGDVNGNGLDDEVVMTGRADNMRWFNTLMNSFVYTWGANYLVNDDGNGDLYFAYTSDAWKEGLKWLRIFFEEGLLTTDLLTNDKAAYNAIINAEGPRCLADGYYWCYSGDRSGGTSVEMMQYEKPIMLTSPVKDKVEGHYQPANPIGTGVVTADCENPLAAFLVMDYLYKENVAITNRYGKQGVNWDFWEDLDESLLPEGRTKEMYASRNTEMYPEPYVVIYGRLFGGSEPQSVSYSGIGPSYESGAMYYGEGVLIVANNEQDQRNIDFDKKDAQHVVDAFKVLPTAIVTEPTLAMTEDELNELGEIKSTLKKYVNESIAAFLTGQWDIETDWDTYLAELDKIGVDKALELYQTAYDRATK